MKHLIHAAFAAFFFYAHAATGCQNSQVAILTSTAETAATVNTATQTNINNPEIVAVINVTAYTSGTYTAYIQGLDVNGNWRNITSGFAISATGSSYIKAGFGIGQLTGASAADGVPLYWRVQLLGTSTPIMTLSIGADLICTGP